MAKKYHISLFKPNNATFVAGAKDLSQVPSLQDKPQFAFVGRSNVGKSSLLSEIMQKKGLVRISSKPGSTRQMNFFNIDNALYLVDLPGYGYARCSQAEQNDWQRIIIEYFINRRSVIKRIFLLIDSRHGLKYSDIEVANIFDSLGMSYQIIFTKVDKISNKRKMELVDEFNEMSKKHPALYPSYLLFSINDKELINGIRHEIIETINIYK